MHPGAGVGRLLELDDTLYRPHRRRLLRGHLLVRADRAGGRAGRPALAVGPCARGGPGLAPAPARMSGSVGPRRSSRAPAGSAAEAGVKLDAVERTLEALLEQGGKPVVIYDHAAGKEERV